MTISTLFYFPPRTNARVPGAPSFTFLQDYRVNAIVASGRLPVSRVRTRRAQLVNGMTQFEGGPFASLQGISQSKGFIFSSYSMKLKLPGKTRISGKFTGSAFPPVLQVADISQKFVIISQNIHRAMKASLLYLTTAR